MLVKIETQARKKSKLNPYLDVFDLQMILVLGLALPVGLKAAIGIKFEYTIWGLLLYILWMAAFKINKPERYFTHWLNKRCRGRRWTVTPSPVNPPFAKVK
jgi:hypothetical protein